MSQEATQERENPNAASVRPHPPDLAKSLDTLQKGLESELKNGKLQLRLEPRGLIISMREATFFASGDDAVAAASLPILAKIAAVVQALPNPVRLEGHTDSRPIHTSRFRSNWELSSARSIAMLELLRDRFQIPGLADGGRGICRKRAGRHQRDRGRTSPQPACGPGAAFGRGANIGAFGRDRDASR